MIAERCFTRAISYSRRSIFLTCLTAAASIFAAPAHAASITLSEAVGEKACKVLVPAQSPNPAVTVLWIGTKTPCTDVTVSSSDEPSASATAPLLPVVVGPGGKLTFEDQKMTLHARSFLVKDGGRMQAGSRGAPVRNKITIIMTGDKSASPAPRATGGSGIVTTTNLTRNSRDITIMDGGELALYGHHGLSAWPNNISNDPKRRPSFINTVVGTESWTYLARPAGPATYSDAENVSSPVPMTNPDTTLTLARAVDWVGGDWISVATTSFSSHQTEIVKISATATIDDPHQPVPITVTGATNANPIVITADSAPISGTSVKISGVLGNTNANGTWTVTRLGETTFALDGAAGNASYTSGGTWRGQISKVTLAQSLKHYHFGGPAPTPGYFPANTTQKVAKGGAAIDVSFQSKSFYDTADRNHGIDERAEVALLSRNIKLTSDAGAGTDATPFVGGHLAAMVSAHGKPPPVVTLVGVEIEKFGQALVGRYPVHLHHLPSATDKVLVQDVSVHHSYNKCFVVHGTANAKFYNNVCVRTVGQGVYTRVTPEPESPGAR